VTGSSTTVQAAVCAGDERCIKVNAVNDGITQDKASATINSPTRDFVTVTINVIEASSGQIRVGVDTIGDRVPTLTDRQALCDLVSKNVLTALGLDRSLLQACIMDPVTRTNKKRQAPSQSTSNVVTMSMKQQSSATATTISALAVFLASLLALNF